MNGVHTVIYTNGSCKEEWRRVVPTVAVITAGTAANPVVIETTMKKGGQYTCSYEEDRPAIREALKLMLVSQKCNDTAVCSDSQALLTSIESWSPETQDIRDMLDMLHERLLYTGSQDTPTYLAANMLTEQQKKTQSYQTQRMTLRTWSPELLSWGKKPH